MLEDVDIIGEVFADGGFGLVILLALPGFLLFAWVKGRFKRALDQDLQVVSRNGYTGVSCARRLLDQAGVLGVRIVPTRGLLVTDHYNPFTKELALSHAIFNSPSVAALGIAAHEVGHAVQHARNYFPVWLRTVLVPVTRVCFVLGLCALCFGMIYSSNLAWIGVALFACCLLFPIINLPIEFDASARAGNLAVEAGIILPEERAGIDRVLRAAALTYVGRMFAAGMVFLGLTLFVAFGQGSTFPGTLDNPLVGIVTFGIFLVVIWIAQQGKTRRASVPGVRELNDTGNLYASQGEFVEAIAEFTRALRLDPQNAEVYANRGAAYYQTKQYDEALADLDRAIRLAPHMAEAYNCRGNVRFGRRELDQAVADYDMALNLQPATVAVLKNRGRAWFEKGDLERARVDCDAILALAPGDRDTYFNRGYIWFVQEDCPRALADFDRAIACDGNHAESYSGRGAAWLVSNEYQKAIDDYNEALRRGGNRATILRDRGLAWMRRGNLRQAIADLDESIQLHGSDAVTYNNRAAALLKRGEYARAAADLEQANRLNPRLPNVYKNLAWLQATCPQSEFRDGAKAVANASRALELANGKAPEWFAILAAAHAEAGNSEEAVRVQTKCLAEAAPGTEAELRHHLDIYKTGQPLREWPNCVEVTAVSQVQ